MYSNPDRTITLTLSPLDVVYAPTSNDGRRVFPKDAVCNGRAALSQQWVVLTAAIAKKTHGEHASLVHTRHFPPRNS